MLGEGSGTVSSRTDGLVRALLDSEAPLTSAALAERFEVSPRTIKREMNSTLATIGIVILQCVVAWLVAFGVYQIGSLIA